MGARRAALGVALLALACGASTAPRPDARAAPTAVPGVRIEQNELAGEGALRHVGEPADLHAILYVPRPRRLGALASLLDAGSGSETAGLEEAARAFLPEALARSIDFERPIAASWFGEEAAEGIVVAVALRDGIDVLRARLAGELVVRRSSSEAWVLEPRSAPLQVACELRRGIGTAPLLLVCGTAAAAVAAHGPYLGRTLTRAPSDAVARLELPRTVMRRIASQGRHEALPAPISDAERLGEETAQRAIEDLDTLALELRVDDADVEATFELGYRAESSPMSIALVSAPRRRDTGALRRMPSDATVALHFAGGAPERMAAPGRKLLQSFVEVMPDDVTDDQGRREMLEAMSGLFFAGGPLTLAYGLDLDRARVALDGFEQGRASLERTRRAFAGWLLIELPESPDRWRNGIRALLQADARATARVRKAGSAVQSTAPDQRPDRYDIATRETPIRAADRLPKGSLHVVSRYTPNPRYSPVEEDDPPPGIAHEWHVFVAPDGDHTWVSSSDDEALARKKLRAVLAAGSPGTLDEAPELARLEQADASVAGFFSIGGLASWFAMADSRQELEESRLLLDEVQRLGKTQTARITVVGSADSTQAPSSSKPVHFRCALRVPRETAKQLGRWLGQLIDGAFAAGP